MATKANNIISFRSNQLNTIVHLVKRSVGKYRKPKHKKDGSDLVYWRGQLAKDWIVWFSTGPGSWDLQQYSFCRGRVVWFDAELFSELQPDKMKSFNVSNQYVGTIDFDLTIAICVIAQIQLAIRHRANNGKSTAIAISFARQLQEMVVAVAPENATILEMGWNPNFDI